MKFKNLTEEDIIHIKRSYTGLLTKEDAQEYLADYYKVSVRTIRNWANKLELNVLPKNRVSSANVMIYDIETCRMVVKTFWTGKQYIGYNQIQGEPRIISISWKWLGGDKVHHLTWDKLHSDKEMMEAFLKEYNKADMVIGINNDSFDNRWINARAAKHRLDVNTMVKSFDVQREMKRVFRIPSYAMKYTAKYFELDQQKMEHEGEIMWQMIEDGTPEQQREYLKKMVNYNVQDILTTEELYISLRKYFGHKMHFGVFDGENKWTCPNCGTNNISLEKTSFTAAGTVQRFMRCNEDHVQFRITNRQYIDFTENERNLETGS